jgi:hypothetical protein
VRGGVHAGLDVEVVAAVGALGELLHQGDHVAVVHLVRQVVHRQLQDRPRVAVLRKSRVVLAETALLHLLGLLVVQLDDPAALQLLPKGGASGSVKGFWLCYGGALREGTVELGEHGAVLHEYVLEFVAGVVVELVGGRDTILVKSMYLIPLSSRSLKKLNSWLIFSSYGAFVMRAESHRPYTTPPGTTPSPPADGLTRRIVGRALRPTVR